MSWFPFGRRRRPIGGPAVHPLEEERGGGGTSKLASSCSSPALAPGLRRGVVAVTGIAIDVSEQRARERESERLAAAAEHGTDAVVSIDLASRICHWNPGAVRLYGWGASEAVGRPLGELLTVFGDEPRDEIARMLVGEGAYQFETQRRRKDATIIDVLLTTSPWTVDGSVVGVTSIAIDVSERKRIERAREQALAELEEAQRTARVGSWSWGPTAEEVSWSVQMYEIFGRSSTSGPATSEDLFAYVHPEDRERVAAGYHRGRLIVPV